MPLLALYTAIVGKSAVLVAGHGRRVASLSLAGSKCFCLVVHKTAMVWRSVVNRVLV